MFVACVDRFPCFDLLRVVALFVLLFFGSVVCLCCLVGLVLLFVV